MEALKLIFSVDFSLSFPFLVDHIMIRLTSHNHATVHASLATLRALAEVFECNLCLNLCHLHHKTYNVQLILKRLIILQNIKLSHPIHFLLPKIQIYSTCTIILPLLLVISLNWSSLHFCIPCIPWKLQLIPVQIPSSVIFNLTCNISSIGFSGASIILISRPISY